MTQITLLHASEDAQLAEQLERQILHANNRVVIAHNNNAMYGDNIEVAWTKTLYTSHLFIVLISADLSNSDHIMRYVHDVIRVEPDRIIMVQIRPCMVEDGHTFAGYKVIPNKAITNYSGAAKKEEIWLQVVRFILDELSDVSEPIGYHEPMAQPTPPIRKFVRRKKELPHPTVIEKPVTPVIERVQPTQPEIREIHVVVLSVPQDKAWLPYIDRTFRIMQRGMDITFTLHHNPGHTIDMVLDAGLTLALLSPDFLAGDYIDLYHTLAPTLGHEKPIIPVMLRECEWSGTVSIPRRSAIKKTGNDAAWVEVTQEIKAILRGRYPGAVPMS